MICRKCVSVAKGADEKLETKKKDRTNKCNFFRHSTPRFFVCPGANDLIEIKGLGQIFRPQKLYK